MGRRLDARGRPAARRAGPLGVGARVPVARRRRCRSERDHRHAHRSGARRRSPSTCRGARAPGSCSPRSAPPASPPRSSRCRSGGWRTASPPPWSSNWVGRRSTWSSPATRSTDRKPHPDAYLRAAELLGVDVAATASAIEDSEPGVASAVASGAATLAVPLPRAAAAEPGLHAARERPRRLSGSPTSARAARGPHLRSHQMTVFSTGDRVQLTGPKGRLHTITLEPGKAVPHPPRRARARHAHRAARRLGGAGLERRRVPGAAPAAVRLRDVDAARRRDHLPEGRGPDPRASPTSSPARPSSRRASDPARSRCGCCGRSEPRAGCSRSSAGRSSPTSRATTSTTFLGEAPDELVDRHRRPRRGAAGDGRAGNRRPGRARHARAVGVPRVGVARRSRPAACWSATSPPRPSSPGWPRRSARPASYTEPELDARRSCAAGTSRASPCVPTTAWSPTPGSSSPHGVSRRAPCCRSPRDGRRRPTTTTRTSNCGPPVPWAMRDKTDKRLRRVVRDAQQLADRTTGGAPSPESEPSAPEQ